MLAHRATILLDGLTLDVGHRDYTIIYKLGSAYFSAGKHHERIAQTA